MGNHIIEVTNLHKSYGSVQAVRGAGFYVERGDLFALLGENGAGKSTTIDILATLLKPDSGEVTVNGHALGKGDDAIRRSIGIVFQKGVLDDKLTVRENLLLRGGFYGLSRAAVRARIDEISGPLGIGEFIDRRYEKLSGGQKRRADITRAMLHTPDILFLDEPTTGLDPASRRAIWNMVKALQQASGTTVLLTTHYMEEAAGADYVVVLGHGQVLARGTPPQLKAEYTSDHLRFEPKDTAEMAQLLEADGVAYTRDGAEFVTQLPATTAALPLLARYGHGFKSFEVLQGTMEEAFLQITGMDRQGGGLL